MNIPSDFLADPANTQTGTAYTFSLNDLGRIVEGDNPAAQTYTVPTAAVAGWPIGAALSVYQAGAGQIRIAGAVGVTLRGAGSALNTNGQYSLIGLRMRADDEWVVTGNATASAL